MRQPVHYEYTNGIYEAQDQKGPHQIKINLHMFRLSIVLLFYALETPHEVEEMENSSFPPVCKALMNPI